VTILGGAARTAAQAAAYLGISPAQIANSLVFTARAARAPAEPLLVLTAGAHRVDTIKVADLLELAELGRADAELVRKRTGFVIGGVAPVGHTPRCGLSSTSPSPATTPSGPPPATPTPPIRATASGLQNRVVLLQQADLGLARLDLDQLLGGGAVSLAAVDLGLDHPATHRLLADTELLGHSCRGGRQRGVPTDVVGDQTHSAFNSSSIFLGMVLILLDSNRSGIKPGALHHSPGLPRRVPAPER